MAELSTIARPYAVAAYRLAKETKALSAWSDMLGLAAAVAQDPQMMAFIADPNVQRSQLEASFFKVCGDKLNAQGQNLIKVLVEYDRLAILPEITQAFEALKAAEEGVLDAEIVTAVKVGDAEIATLVKRLEAKFGKKIEASVSVDPSIIGGVKVLVGDTVIDASVSGQLQNLAYTLKA